MTVTRVYWLVLVCASWLAVANAVSPQLVFQQMHDLQSDRDVAYSGKLYPGVFNSFVVTGVTTTPAGLGNTGLDFFALMVDTNTGDRKTSFGDNGLVTVDFNNVGGTSRTDVATELVFLTNPARIALLGESVVSQAPPTNLSFAIAMLDSTGNLVSSFADGGLGLYDIDSGANDEIFFGDVDTANNLVVGGFANPTPVTGAGPAFNCALLKLNQYGARDTQWGQNGQLIIDFNGWDERCRAGLPLKNRQGHFESYLVGGRSKPAPGFNTTLVNGSLPNPPVLNVATHDQNNFRATMTSVDYATGSFNAAYGRNDFGFGRSVLNTNNGSFETIKLIQVPRKHYLPFVDSIMGPPFDEHPSVIALGNWGGWDNGVSGNKAIGLLKWDYQGHLDRSWGNGGITSINPPRSGGQSFDVYSLVIYREKIYVVGGTKLTASINSPPRSIIARFHLSSGQPDLNFGDDGVYYAPQITNTTSSLYKSAVLEGDMMYISGEAGVPPGTRNNMEVLVAKFRLPFF